MLGPIIAVALAVTALAGTAVSGVSAREQLAADEPHLPAAPEPIAPLHLDKNGQIVPVDPTQELGAGQRLCGARTLCVGPGQPYSSLTQALAAVREGDTIEIVGGTYHETAIVRTKGVTLRGIRGRPHFDCAGLRIAENKACLLLEADDVTLENFEISGAVISDALGANGACIRNDAGLSFTLRGIICHGSQDGLLTNGGKVLIENSEFYDNGWTGQTHNVYLGGDCLSATVRGSTFRDARVGHEFKSRCARTDISDSTFRSTRGSRNLDIPDGGATTIYRSLLVKTPGAQNSEFIGFAAELCRYPADMIVKDTRIENSNRDGAIHNFDKCAGNAIVLDHVTFEGLPVREEGYILKR